MGKDTCGELPIVIDAVSRSNLRDEWPFSHPAPSPPKPTSSALPMNLPAGVAGSDARWKERQAANLERTKDSKETDKEFVKPSIKVSFVGVQEHRERVVIVNHLVQACRSKKDAGRLWCTPKAGTEVQTHPDGRRRTTDALVNAGPSRSKVSVFDGARLRLDAEQCTIGQAERRPSHASAAGAASQNDVPDDLSVHPVREAYTLRTLRSTDSKASLRMQIAEEQYPAFSAVVQIQGQEMVSRRRPRKGFSTPMP
ncbi:hypothetical protein R3P38DRAFT_2795985 [Favolaschia claudopus]|uniref:Uncharacterized protein n=1 Tax=Favolaschia claudopus TaxID=2862362 RepID=A0AAW0A6E7_9AGAR